MGKLMDLGTMDNYYEQIVKRKMSSNTRLAIIFGIVLTMIAFAGCVFLANTLPVLALVAIGLLGVAIYLVYYMISNAGIEYEYTFVVGEMRIERIKGQKKRRKVTSFDVKAVDDIGKYHNPETGEKNVDPSKHKLVLRAEENDENEDTYYLIIHDKIRHKPALLIFSPNEITLEKLRPFLSVELKKKFMSIHPFTQK